MKRACFLFFIGSLFFFVLSGNALSAQTAKDTTKKSILSSVKKDTGIYIQYVFQNDINTLYAVDTSLTGFQNFNPLYRQPIPYAHLGNAGTPHRPLIFNPIAESGFDFGFHQFDLYNFSNKNVRYYNTTKPFTDATFAIGKKEEQFFNLIHTQNIKPNINIGFDFQKISSEGLYQRQKTSDQSLNVFGWYQTPDKRYNLLLNFIYNKTIAEESGGMTLDTLFENDSTNEFYFQRKAVPVHLQSAENHRREKSAFIQQSWDFGKKYQKKINDSTALNFIFSKARIQHSFQFQNTGYAYRDDVPPDSGFYPTAYFGYDITLDSSHLYQYSNTVAFQYLGNKNLAGDSVIYSNTVFEAGLTHDYIDIYQTATYGDLFSDSILENISGKIYFGSNPHAKTRFIYRLKGSYGISGYNQNDYTGNALMGYRSEKTGELKIQFSVQEASPPWIAQHYSGNNFLWENSFKKVKTVSGGVIYSLPKHHLDFTINQYSIENYLYWDSISQPKQTSENLQTTVISLKKDFAWKNLHLDNSVFAQFFPDEKYLHFPEFISYHSFYFQNHLFRKVLFAQFGFDIRYTDSYFADAYMPATGQFYLQNSKELRFYPVIDFFVNLKIKRARLFFKVENLNQQLPENGYYSIPFYPMPDRAFKAGINWRFYN